MSFPTSWQTNQGRNLSDCMPVVGSIPAGVAPMGNIFWNEWKDGRNERWSMNTTSAATMRFATNSDALRDPIRRRILHDSLLGGYSKSDGKKHQPYEHPFAKGLYAKDVVSIESMAANKQPKPTGNEATSQYLRHSVDVLTVSFESLPYPVKRAYSPSDLFNPNFIETEVRPASTRIQSPLGWNVISTGPYSEWAAMLGNFTTMPTSVIVMTIHQVLRSWVYPANSLSLYPFFQPFFGMVNQSALASWGAEKLLLDSAEIREYHNMLGEPLCDIRLIFQANDWGWNKTLDPGASVQSMRLLSTGSGLKPFPTFGLGTVLSALNPM